MVLVLVLAGMVPVTMPLGTIGDLTVTATMLILTGTAGIGRVAATIGGSQLVSCPINNMAFVAIKMGRRQGGPSRTGSKEGAYLDRYVTDEQRSRRLIFSATLRAVASWLFFGVARFLRINSDMLVARALKNSQLTDGESHVIYGTGH